MIRRAVLVGLSGSGKSSVGQRAANLLQWELVDTDAEIERRTGRSVPDLFRVDGEAAFRAIEAGVMADALARDEVVIATGGGAVVHPSTWAPELLGSPSNLVVWLDAAPDVLVERLRAQAAARGAAAERPLLAGDAIGRLRDMRDRRRDAYARASVTVPVADRTEDSLAADIAELARLGRGEESCLELRAESARSSIRVGMRTRHRLGEVVQHRWPRAMRCWVVVDGNLEPHVSTVVDALGQHVGIVHTLAVEPGESSKSMTGLARLHDWMLGGGIERSDVVVALGGGMVGDLAGFAAATVLRGVGLVQVPTTLLSMVDSSVGGKTGINHAAGKNLIGAFYQPPEVVIDPGLLATLPERELRSGWAEIIKHAVIEPSTPGGDPPVLLDVLERNRVALARLDQPITPWLIRCNVSLKAAVVEADEREAGIRAFLNFGHTIGHALEAAGFTLLHGEAVAVGMCAALHLAREMGRIDGAFEERVRALIQAFGLPLTAAVEPEQVRQKMASDKKKAAGRQTWVLPASSGGVELVVDVPDALVDAAIARVTRHD